jgi:hypothetical protein
MQQLHAERGLELLQQRGDTGLRQPEAIRRASDAPGLDDPDEDLHGEELIQHSCSI